MRKGSITIAAALSLMLVTSFLFLLLEGVRLRTGEVIAKRNTDGVLESVFSQYEIPLWENYHLLARFVPEQEGVFLFGNLEQEMKELSQVNLNPKGSLMWKNHMLRMDFSQMTVASYDLLTDQEGKVYQAAVSSYIKNNPLAFISNRKEEFQELLDGQKEDSSTSIDNALNSIEEEKQAVKESTSGGGGTGFGDKSEVGTTENTVEIKENPLEVVKDFQTKGILALVLEDSSSLSKREMKLENLVSHRSLKKGTSAETYEDSWYDSLLVLQYYKSIFEDFQSDRASDSKEGKTLCYEMEYLLCGEGSDLENLKGVVTRLLAIREAANLLTLATDSARQNEAYAIATAIGGFTGNPALIEVVKIGVLAAWAFVESILDIRALLQGDKIPLVKTKSQWTSNIWNLSSSAGGYAKAKPCSNGLDYSTYLENLLLCQEGGKTAYRAMDLQEKTINQQEGYEDFRMDQAIVTMKLKVKYEMESLFLSNVTIGNVKSVRFFIDTQSEYSYLKAGV